MKGTHTCNRAKDNNNSDANTNKMLGRWAFDKKRKKNAYISLSGKKYYGADAVNASRADKYRHNNPQLSSRPELHRLMNCITSDSLLAGCRDARNQDDNEEDVGTISKVVDPLTLEYWGVPIRTCQRYAQEQRVERLFQWQVDCLACEEGYALNGGNLVYSAPTSGYVLNVCLLACMAFMSVCVQW
jgi:hypothetical protein